MGISTKPISYEYMSTPPQKRIDPKSNCRASHAPNLERLKNKKKKSTSWFGLWPKIMGLWFSSTGCPVSTMNLEIIGQGQVFDNISLEEFSAFFFKTGKNPCLARNPRGKPPIIVIRSHGRSNHFDNIRPFQIHCEKSLLLPISFSEGGRPSLFERCSFDRTRALIRSLPLHLVLRCRVLQVCIFFLILSISFSSAVFFHSSGSSLLLFLSVLFSLYQFKQNQSF